MLPWGSQEGARERSKEHPQAPDPFIFDLIAKPPICNHTVAVELAWDGGVPLGPPREIAGEPCGTSVTCSNTCEIMRDGYISQARRCDAKYVHDALSLGVYKNEIGPKPVLESVSRGVWHCVAQHLENAAQRSAKLPGRPILRPPRGRFTVYNSGPLAHHGRTMHHNAGLDKLGAAMA